MPVMNMKALSKSIAQISKSSAAFATSVQEALISAAYYAMKDGNITPFNDILSAVGNGTRKKGITMWAELFAPVYIKEEKFAFSKKAALQFAILNEGDFAEYEAAMREGPLWCDIVGKEKVQSVWSADSYLENVVKTLRKHGVDSDVIAKVEAAEMEVRIAKTALAEETRAA